MRPCSASASALSVAFQSAEQVGADVEEFTVRDPALPL